MGEPPCHADVSGRQACLFADVVVVILDGLSDRCGCFVECFLGCCLTSKAFLKSRFYGLARLGKDAD